MLAAERPAAAGRLVAALKDAAGAALLALGLAVPILALRIDQDINNQPILRPRWDDVALAVALVFAARLAWLLLRPALTGTAAASRQTAARRSRAAGGYLAARAFAIVGAVLLVLYPLLMLALVGRAGAIKWIDNFGIQILIYVMLGWGLNIVVGLAGLLDLGYVAFYAVGAYSTALLVHNLGFGFWLCLPLAGIFAALWGILLGFPVLRLQGRLPRHRHPGVRRDHPAGADQLGAGHQRLCRHLGHPQAHLLRPALQCQRRRASPPPSASSSRRCTARSFSST